MKFKIKTGTLLEGLEKVKGTVDNPKADISSKVYIRAFKTESWSGLFLYSTNNTASSVVKVACDVDEPGRMLIDHDKLIAGLVKRDPELQAEFKLEESAKAGQIEVKVGRAKIKLPFEPKGTQVMDERMNRTPFKGEAAYTVPGKRLVEFVRRGMFCIPKDGGMYSDRLILNGMKLLTSEDGYEAQATDGHALIRIVVKGEKGPSQMNGVMIPQTSLPPLSKLLRKEDEVKVIEGPKGEFGPSSLFFKIGENVFFETRLLHGSFPDLKDAIQRNSPDFWFTVDRQELKAALDRVAAYDDMRHVELEIEGTVLNIRGRSKLGQIDDAIELRPEDGMPVTLKGIKCKINLDYLTNGVNGSQLERVRLGMSNQNEASKKTRALILDDQDADKSIETLMAVSQIRQ